MHIIDRLSVPVNGMAMILNIVIFSLTDSWPNAIAAVFSAAVAGWCQWDNRLIVKE